MKIQQTSQQTSQKVQNLQTENPKKVSFGNATAVTSVLNFLQTNQGWGAASVDLFSMVIPRTAVDFTRGPDAGVETARREFSSAINDAAIGVYGMIAAAALAVGVNNKFGVKAHKMFISGDMLDILGKAWQDKKAGTDEKTLQGFLTHVVNEARGFNPNVKIDNHEIQKLDTAGWVNIDSITQESVVKKLKEGILNLPEDKKAYKEFKAHVKSLIVGSTGVESEFKLEQTITNKKTGKEEIQKATASVDDFIDNIYKSSKTFMSKNVAAEFKPGAKTADNEFIKRMKNLNQRTALLGLALSLIVGLSIQPLNVYLTKKKTGKTGFVGVEGKEGDKTEGFNTLKFGVGALAILGALSTISTKPSEILKKIQFKSLYPSLDQFKLVYGTTIASRIFSARDKNELRETTTKDSMGFINWLILGGFVSKLTAIGFEKLPIFKKDGEKFLKHNVKENGNARWRFITGSVVTREEVLHTALKKAGIATIDKNGIALTFKQMLEKAPKEAKTKLKYLTFVQLAGYLYSGLVLGVGMPKFNIAMTKLAEKKRKAAEEAKAKAAA